MNLNSDAARVHIRVHPKAASNRIGAVVGSTVRVYVTAPPVDGKANAAAIELLAEALGVAKSRVTIQRGERGRNKVVAVEGLDYEAAMARLAAAAG